MCIDFFWSASEYRCTSGLRVVEQKRALVQAAKTVDDINQLFSTAPGLLAKVRELAGPDPSLEQLRAQAQAVMTASVKRGTQRYLSSLEDRINRLSALLKRVPILVLGDARFGGSFRGLRSFPHAQIEDFFKRRCAVGEGKRVR
jgi:hypothetical protein